MHRRHRAKLMQRIRDLPAPGLPPRSLLLLQGGASRCRDETDDEPLFRQESAFHYLFGVREPDVYGTINADTCAATLYVPRLPEAYTVWQGAILPPEHFRDYYGVDRALYSDQLKEDFAAAAPTRVFLSRGYNQDGKAWSVPASFDGLETFPVDATTLLYDLIVECRLIKTDEEIALMQYTNNITSDAHLEVMRRARPGMFEYQLESLFLHDVYFRGKCRHAAYTSICGCGPNSAVLHYGHAAAPNDRLIGEGDMLLLDMGAEYHRYASDVTCSFPASGKFSADQRAVFEAVAAAQSAVMDAMRPGVRWPDMHALAYDVICRRLAAMGLLRGSGGGDSKANVGAVFMPHGLGHLMGIDTHDVGGYPAGAARDPRPGFASLRCVRTLVPGMVITVEPGTYFIDALLDKALADPALNRFLVPEALQRFRGFGGVRLEDDVLVTADGVRNLTNCPRTVADIEGVMAGRITNRQQL
ncbi:unnamed protein product, partial [Phaeothamnion confervicola]